MSFHHLEQIETVDDIVLKVFEWLGLRLANISVGSKMHDDINREFVEDRFQCIFVSEIAVDEVYIFQCFDCLLMSLRKIVNYANVLLGITCSCAVYEVAADVSGTPGY